MKKGRDQNQLEIQEKENFSGSKLKHREYCPSQQAPHFQDTNTSNVFIVKLVYDIKQNYYWQSI